MTPEDRHLQLVTRRHFFSRCAIGLGQIALANLLSDGRLFAADGAPANPMAPRPPHFAPKAKNVIYLFMAGGPSQLELFDHKPKLQEYDGKPIPESFVEGKRFAFMDTVSREPRKLLGTRRKFASTARAAPWVSELLPHLATVTSTTSPSSRRCSTDVFNHGPAKCS